MQRALLGLLYVIMLSSKVMAGEFLEKPYLSSLTEARPTWSWGLALYNGQRTYSRLPTFPYNALTGRLTFADAQVSSIILSKHLLDIDIQLPFSKYRMNGLSFEAEATINKHSGLQKHAEVTSALVTRSGEFLIGSRMSMNLAWANGFSYALAKPSWEYGPSKLLGVDTIQLQYFMAFEAEFRRAAAQDVSWFVRLHHRSGIYGAISSQNTGSNYIGAGLRILLP